MSDSHEANLSKVAKNSLISGMGSTFVMLTGPVTSVITTRALGAELFGVYSVAQSLSGVLANVSSLGLHGANLRFIPSFKAKGDKPRIKGSILWTMQVSLGVSTAFAILVFLFPDLFREWFVNRPGAMPEGPFEATVSQAFRFYALSIPLSAAYLTALSSLNGLQAITLKVLANDILGALAKIISLVILLWIGFDLYAALGSNLLQDLTILVFSWYFLLKAFPELRDRRINTEHERMEISRFAGTLFANSLLNRYTFQLDVLFLGFFSSVKEVGIYTVALRLQPLIYMPHYTISTIFGPLAAELHAASRQEDLKRLFQTVTKWSFSLSLPICAVVILFSEEILNIFGKEFVNAGPLIVIMALSNLVHDMIGLGGTLVTMVGKVKWTLLNSICIAVTNLVFFYFFIKAFGALGAAIGYSLSVLTLDTLLLVEAYMILGVLPIKKSIYKPLLSMLVAGTVVGVAKWGLARLPFYEISFMVYVLAMVSIYVVVLFLLKFDAEDDFILDRISRRVPFLAGPLTFMRGLRGES